MPCMYVCMYKGISWVCVRLLLLQPEQILVEDAKELLDLLARVRDFLGQLARD